MTNTFTNNPERRDLQITEIERRRYIVNLARNKAKTMLSYDFPGIDQASSVEYAPEAYTHTKQLPDNARVVTLVNNQEEADGQANNLRIDLAQRAVMEAHTQQLDISRENLSENQHGFPG